MQVSRSPTIGHRHIQKQIVLYVRSAQKSAGDGGGNGVEARRHALLQARRRRVGHGRLCRTLSRGGYAVFLKRGEPQPCLGPFSVGLPRSPCAMFSSSRLDAPTPNTPRIHVGGVGRYGAIKTANRITKSSAVITTAATVPAVILALSWVLYGSIAAQGSQN